MAINQLSHMCFMRYKLNSCGFLCHVQFIIKDSLYVREVHMRCMLFWICFFILLLNESTYMEAPCFPIGHCDGNQANIN